MHSAKNSRTQPTMIKAKQLKVLVHVYYNGLKNRKKEKPTMVQESDSDEKYTYEY